MDFRKKLLVRAGSKINLADFDAAETFGYEKDDETKKLTHKTIKRMDVLQYKMFADNRYALLIVLQGLDAGGKDGTVRHVLSGVDPMGCQVTAFKQPSHEELQHDFLWRVHKAVPERGRFGIFNRSHYEDVLVVRVHKLVPKAVWEPRFEQINRFESLLVQNNVVILKFFLHISKGEQKKRFLERLEDPTHEWKASPADFEERRYWSEYIRAYEDVLGRCSTRHAPWFIVPSDHKWFRNLAISRIITETLEDLNLRFPKPSFDISKIKVK
jgi:PPK2 family polyphosphate:nucleotide phosphotransferase